MANPDFTKSFAKVKASAISYLFSINLYNKELTQVAFYNLVLIWSILLALYLELKFNGVNINPCPS